MKTYFTTSFGQPGGSRGGLAEPVPLCVVGSYRGSPAIGPAGPCASAPYPDYCGFAPVASVGGSTPDFNPFVCCLALFSLLLAARLLAGLPPAAASSQVLPAIEGHALRQEAVAALPANAALPSFVVAHVRAGPVAPPALGTAYWLRGSTGHSPP